MVLWARFCAPSPKRHSSSSTAEGERAGRSKEKLCGVHSCSVLLWEAKPEPAWIRGVFESLKVTGALESDSVTGARTTQNGVQNRRLHRVPVADPSCPVWLVRGSIKPPLPAAPTQGHGLQTLCSSTQAPRCSQSLCLLNFSQKGNTFY